MDWIYRIPYPVAVGFVFLFGLMIGSFANVCIHRLPRRESVVFPGSHCPACNTPVRALDNIPVLSYLLLSGRCRSCGESISGIYPLVELITALLITAIFIKFGFTWESLIFIIVGATLVVVTAIDLEHKIIPDRITLPGIVFGLGAGSYLVGIGNSLLGLLIGGGLFYLLAIVSRGGMGGGDIKFIAGVGALLGWKMVLLVIFLGAFLGSCVGLTQMALQGKSRKSQIPFGPYLAAGTLIAMFSGDEIIRLYLSAMSGGL